MNYNDEDLLRYGENTLGPERTRRLLDAAEHDSELRSTLAALDASRLPYKAAFAQQDVPPVPFQLQKQVREWIALSKSESEPEPASAQQGSQGRFYKPVLAACVVLSFAGGYLAATLQENSRELTISSNPAGGTDAALNSTFPAIDEVWVKRVADYQSLYVANTVNSISTSMQATKTLLAGITQQTGLQTGIPDLTEHGYKFVRAQELGFEGETLVQLVYFKPGKSPLALCYMKSDQTESTAANVLTHSGLGVAHWRSAGQRFVIVADENAEQLEQLSSQARQLWI